MPRRLIQLFAGLVLYGISDSMLLLAGLGVDPWDVLHQGLARRIGLQTGTWAIIVGVGVLVLWVPLRQRPGFGTLCNVVLIGLVIDMVLAIVAPPRALPARAAVMVSGVVLNGVATGMYIGAGLGPGPRDGLMTGFAARGHSVRVVRTGIEAAVLAMGWLLGGTVGVGTVVYAVCIGPLAHVFVPLFARDRKRDRHRHQRQTPACSGGLDAEQKLAGHRHAEAAADVVVTAPCPADGVGSRPLPRGRDRPRLR